MKKMRYSDEHKKRWFLLSVVDLSYYKSYQVRLERGREGELRMEEITLFALFFPKQQVMLTITFERFISTPPPTFPHLGPYPQACYSPHQYECDPPGSRSRLPPLRHADRVQR